MVVLVDKRTHIQILLAMICQLGSVVWEVARSMYWRTIAIAQILARIS